jgi:GNAT superfamily N-acetyltransferase
MPSRCQNAAVADTDVTDLDVASLRVAYDAQMRAIPCPIPTGVQVQWDGPVLRMTGLGRGILLYNSVADLPSAALDALIARQRDWFAACGQAVEWKHHGHDLPADLPQRLVAAGFEPEDLETVVVGLAAAAASAPPLPDGVTLRTVSERADLDRIADLEATVWQSDRGWLAEDLGLEVSSDPDAISIMVAEAAGEVVCAGWIRFGVGCQFASLWGGSTLPAWRGRGIYRSLVAARAALAIARGVPYLQVDASDDSRPILARLGFVTLTTTTPYVFRPARATDG